MTDKKNNPRIEFERWNRERLASWAVLESAFGGRKTAEPEHPYRTCFQRDRDRIIHCSAFRRLDFKTQVFVPHEQDHFRTRLTHTLEVAQVARTLARALSANEDLAEATALAHDLGHPPFGHGGEVVLNELMCAAGGFEHNLHSLRIVDYLEHPYPDFRGLNLTNAVRECIGRHSTRYDSPDCAEFDGSVHAPIEGQIVDAADEIAFTAADLDDALSAGWITAEQLQPLTLWSRAWEMARDDFPDARDIHIRIRACKNVLGQMADDFIETTIGNIAMAGTESLDDVRNAKPADTSGKLARFSERMNDEIDQLQKFLLKNVYLNEKNSAKDKRGRQIIQTLFTAYIRDPSLLPRRYQKRIDTDGAERTICDYIAGMTDRYAQELAESRK